MPVRIRATTANIRASFMSDSEGNLLTIALLIFTIAVSVKINPLLSLVAALPACPAECTDTRCTLLQGGAGTIMLGMGMEYVVGA
jgi:hypothetical protein